MYKAMPDAKGKLYSYLGIVLFSLITILLFISLKQNDISQVFVLWLIFLLVFSIPYLRQIKGYSITDKEIIIHRHFKNIIILKSNILDAQIVEPELLKQSRRVFSDGGLLGYTGTYSNSTLGIMEVYCTNLNTTIILVTQSHKILISPNDLVGFMVELGFENLI
ncbi:MAG: PH domain-containing protein [Sediminibacterium sp.]|jgi:hypothetical protein|nr:hypothetical protein [Chitinophagaceae bacterium]MCA6447658.1 hypothetical protein [Chitinophagaceae bacterium]